MIFVAMLVMMIFVAMLVMMIFVAMLVMLVMLVKGQRRDTRSRDQGLAFKVCGLNQARQPTFKIQAINYQKIGFAECARVRWCRGINMGIGTSPNQNGRIDSVTANLLNPVTKNGKARHHIQRIFILCICAG